MVCYRKQIAAVLVLATVLGLCACSKGNQEEKTIVTDFEYIETTLNLANNEEQEWTYQASADAWILSVVSAVAYPELPDQQGVSVCVPGAYVVGIDTDGDGMADVTAGSLTEAGDMSGEVNSIEEQEDGFAADVNLSSVNAVKGSLVINYEATVTSTNGQIYTAATAPVVLNTGAAGYSSQQNSLASTLYAADGYINVSCGNRGKQDTATDDDGNTYYTGDAPSCLVDQKAAARYVKYNILLGNLPGNVNYFISTGGSGGGAHAAMFAATGNNSDYYDYQIEAGAVGIYLYSDGTYATTVSIDGTEVELSDGAWGCIAYSAITSLYEADMALAFEYYLNAEYSFKTSFQAQLAAYLSESYMEYINEKHLSVQESDVGFDLDGDGALHSTVALTIEYNPETHPETNGYYGTYLDLYLAEFTQNLQWYLDHLDYAEGWTWFHEDGTAMTDAEVAEMTSADKVQAFVEGRYTKGSGVDTIGGMPDDMMGDPPGGIMGDIPDDMMGGFPDYGLPDGDLPDSGFDSLTDDTDILPGDLPSEMIPGGDPENGNLPEGEIPGDSFGGTIAGTPEDGTMQSATGSIDSANYASYEEMLEAYRADIEDIYAGDKYGNNIVELYHPLNYIGADGTDNPTWVRIVMGASEGDISMFNSLNLQIAWLNAGVDAEIEWQWDGGLVPSEVLGDSFSLYVDQMYGEYVEGAVSITKPEAVKQTQNGTSVEASGKDISSWVSIDSDSRVSFTLADIAAYRTAGASKAMPGFDVIDYGQEDYVFGDTEQDARHWNIFLLEILEEYEDVLKPLFNGE